jgi:UDP-N-acetylglucosamine--N-acetylmuramyl-(pentapeptide) pyrophosphoryl-undecaprenol N-acetylglucosamine transferase
VNPRLKVYIGCFGSGLGHASRMLEVAGELSSRGARIAMSSSGEVAQLVLRKGYQCNVLPLADVKYSQSGEFALKETMVASPSILGRTYQQVAMEVSNILRFGPDVVLSDSALSTVLASRILRLPAYTVLNQLNLTSSHGNQGAPARLLSTGTSAGMGKLWEFSDEILLPDLPPPYTISERNLWGSSVEKTRYIGFLNSSDRGDPDHATRDFVDAGLPKVFWQVSGPPKTRRGLLTFALRAAEALRGSYSFVVSGGDPSADKSAAKIPGGWYYGWCESPEHYFGACDAVVSRAGHGTIGQAVSASKPSLLVPIPRQPEQEGNAEKAARLGVSIVVTQEQLTLERLREALGSLLSGPFSEKARQLGAFANKFDARGEIVRTVEEAATSARQVRR